MEGIVTVYNFNYYKNHKNLFINNSKVKLIRITTVPASLRILLRGQLKFMSNHFEVVGISSSGCDLELVALNEGIRTEQIDMTRRITPFNDLISLYKLYKIFRSEHPLIVHTHTPKAGLLGMLAAKIAGVPIRLHTVAGMPLLEAKGMKLLLLKAMEKSTYYFANKVYPNSNVLKEIIYKSKFCSLDKLKVISNGSSNGIDTSYFDPNLFSNSEKAFLREKLGIKQDEIVFCFVGRIVADKGIKELIASFEKCVNLFPNIKLLLVGSYENDLDPIGIPSQTLINQHFSIIHVGFQEDIRPYLAISNIFVFPSYREGFPNVVLQASAMGLPCIVSNINGCNEIIQNGVNGIIVPVKDTNALFNAFIKFIKNPEISEKMSKEGRSLICRKYEQRVVWNALLTEYQELISHLK